MVAAHRGIALAGAVDGNAVDACLLTEQLKGSGVALADSFSVDKRAVGVLFVADDLVLLCRLVVVLAAVEKCVVNIQLLLIVAQSVGHIVEDSVNGFVELLLSL